MPHLSFIGEDLAVTPNFVAYDAAGIDLVRVNRPATGLLAPGVTEAYDLATFGGRENLAQALILRLLTPRGSLAALGHSGYGSRLHELIGKRKTSTLRNLCRAYVLEVVRQEPRVEDEAVELVFDPAAETPESFVFTLAVSPREGGELIALTLRVEV